MVANVNVAALNFDDIKQSLKDFLSGQEQFADYNFEGANVNILLDILAANSHFYAAYANLIGNEMFLDSALLRSSVVSNAKAIGYVPRSMSASKATLGVTLSDVTGTPGVIVLGKGTKFTTLKDGVEYTFVTTSAYNMLPTSPTVYNVPSITVYEGKLVQYSWLYSSQEKTRFILPHNNVDVETITLTIQTSTTNSFTEIYTRAKNIVGVTPTSKVFYIQEIDGQLFEITFGDGVIGKAIENGNIVRAEYVISSADAPNSAIDFTLATNLYPNATPTVTTVMSAAGGAGIESTDSIKLNAKAYYESQNRSVIPADYEANIRLEYPNIKDLKVWGGEENIPPQYGKVFAAVLADDLLPSSVATKEYIKTLISKKNMISIRPEIVDPELFYVVLSVTSSYDQKLTNVSAETLATSIKSTIATFGSDNLERFGAPLRPSALLATIDSSNQAILGSGLETSIYYNLNITGVQNYVIQFLNKITEGSVSSDGFTIEDAKANTVYYLEDVSGDIKMYGITEGDARTKFYLPEAYGTVNYTSGEVNITSFLPILSSGYELKVYMVPSTHDILSTNQQVLLFDMSKCSVVVTAE
jgi:hypothetical protein